MRKQQRREKRKTDGQQVDNTLTLSTIKVFSSIFKGLYSKEVIDQAAFKLVNLVSPENNFINTILSGLYIGTHL